MAQVWLHHHRFSCAIMSTSDASTTAATAKKSRPVIYLTGDSLTQRGTDPDNAGWVALMQHRYHRSADVVTRGLSGYNTKWFIEAALPVIETELSSDVALITLWLGANDAALPGTYAERQHVPLATYKENLVKIVHTYQTKAPQANILLITPPHVDDAVRGGGERTNDTAGDYARACVESAAESGVNVLDLHSFFNAMLETERAACLNDGLHFTAKGNRLMDEQLQLKIREAFPDLVKLLEAWQLPDFHIWMDA
ncbi:Isoamyl acetate-hydrolyzing esterase [Phytophthora megakarya]|uniref:Isoamyl acetate-hydrolyzing esterase n=1 Tax=Phytophthora megakarya TaxID=4795 RepID=A0A225WUW7_9STRA|nr:Isoamyl acetate-hydrolyzing esterase [Phytophthora megakarya]